MTKKQSKSKGKTTTKKRGVRSQKKKKTTAQTSAIIFRHTGHFWNDLGVIALWRWLAEDASEHDKDTHGNPVAIHDGVQCVLSSERLEISDKDVNAYKVLERAAEAFRAQVWQPTKSGKMWWVGPSGFLYTGQNKPDFLLAYDQLPMNAQWKSTDQCDVCGDTDKPVRTTGTSYNPLLVNVEKMSGFYSELKGGYKICQSCAFAAPFSLNQLWFSFGDRFLALTLLWPVSSDLLLADRFLRQTSGLRLMGDTTHNYPHAFGYANSPISCFLDLMCSFWEQSRTSVSANVLEMAMAGVQFHTMQLSKPNTRSNVINVDRYEIIPDPVGVLRLIQACDQLSKQRKVWNTLVNTLNQMPIRREDGADTHLLDDMAKAIITRSPIEEAIEARIYSALDKVKSDLTFADQFNTVAFQRFIPTYFEEVKDMATDLLPALQSVGETLGKLVKVTDDRSILYNLRNARHIDDLLDVLSRVVVRHADTFIAGEVELWRKELRQLVELMDNSNWRRVRSLLGIYAGLKFIDMSTKKSGGSSESTKV